MTTWTNVTESNAPTYSYSTKNSTTWSSPIETLSLGLWSALVYPWQLSTPWDTPGSTEAIEWTYPTKN